MLESLDHVVVAVRDLAGAAERTAALLGGAPSWRGRHAGMGTENALFRLENTYLELLAPAGEGALGAQLAARLAERGDGLVALAFGTRDADACAAALRQAGLPALDPAPGEGEDPDSGALRRWRNVLVAPEATRGPWLFAIEHLAGSAPMPEHEPSDGGVTALDHVVVASGDLEASRALYEKGLGLRLALARQFESRGIAILFFRVGGVTVEVVGALGAAPAATDRLSGLAWRVRDIEAARARIDAAGFDASDVRAGAKPGTRVFTVRGEPCGVPTLILEDPARA